MPLVRINALLRFLKKLIRLESHIKVTVTDFVSVFKDGTGLFIVTFIVISKTKYMPLLMKVK